MKQIEDNKKKAYLMPTIEIIKSEISEFICGSNDPDPEPDPQPSWYDDELD
ncbi:MAG: hypothetical protein MJZ32_02840 [Bacteroidaceae bacterium]|nr:hypothetical protein [Bacteroidaceae bacterium]